MWVIVCLYVLFSVLPFTLMILEINSTEGEQQKPNAKI
jgi:hypothetical protein